MQADEPSGQRTWPWLVAWCALAALFTVLMVQESIRDGRLRAGPVYDDVSYFIDALERLQVFDAGGIPGLARGVVRGPPHSPWSSSVAFVSYLLLGRHDWAPYAGNFVIVFALLVLVACLMRDMPAWAKAGGAFFVLAVPMTGLAVTEFRPDSAAGLATAAAVLLTVEDGLRAPMLRSRILLGALWGAALLIKPSIVPQTLLLFAGALTARTLVARFGMGCTWRQAATWRTWLIVPALALAFALPYYIVAGEHVFSYIWNVIAGSQQAVWRMPGTWRDHALFFLTGSGGAAQLGYHLWLVVGLLLLGTLIVLRHGSRGQLWHWGSLAALLAIAYGVPTANLTKNPFLGLSFQWLALLMAVLGLRAWWIDALPSAGWSRRLRIGGGWLVIVLAMLIVDVRWPRASYGGYAVGGDVQTVRTVVEAQRQIYDVVSGHVGKGTFVYFTAPGSVDGTYVRYRLLQEGRDARTHVSIVDTEFASILHQIERADVIVAAESGSGLTEAGLPAAQFEDRALQTIRSMPDLREVARVPAFNGRFVYIFARRAPFEGLEQASGLGAEEGPYPQWGMPAIVRWGLGPATRVTLESDRDVEWDLQMRAWANVPDQSVTVVLNQQVVQTLEVPNTAPYSPTHFTIRLPMRAGENELELRYARQAEDPTRPMAVLFERLSLVPAEGEGG